MTGRVTATIYATDYRAMLRDVAAIGGADLIATSPPYADARTYGANVSWTDADYAALGDACFAALKPGGWLLLNVDAPVREWRPGMGTERGLHPWRLLLDYADRIGFRVPDRLAFARFGAPGAYYGRFRNDWEPLLWFQRPGARGYFDKPFLDEKQKWPDGGDPSIRTKDGRLVSRKRSGPAHASGVTRRGTLWKCLASSWQTGARDIEMERHPARWPYNLARDIVGCFSAPGSLVVDPFCGAGTTGAAAVDLGRSFIGSDAFARQDDGTAWADVTAGVIARRIGSESVRVVTHESEAA